MKAKDEEKLAKLMKKLEKIDAKLSRAETGAKYNALLIDRRDIELKIWKLDPVADVSVR